MKDEILACLPPQHPWGQHLQVYECTDSTNLRLKELAARGAPEGTAVIAEAQSAGRGRLGRSFHSPTGGLYLSVLLRPGCVPGELMHLTCGVAVAVCDAVEDVTHLRPGIKWINDLLVGKRKLAGILTELSLTPKGTVDFAVVGIGINCGNVPFPPELESIACTLEQAVGTPVSKAGLAAAVLMRMEELSRGLHSHRSAILDRYRSNCVTLGAQVRLLGSQEPRVGTALDMDDRGALLVQFPDGQTQWVNSGEVSVRGLWDYTDEKF